jgi:hypothetical protein
MDTGEDSYDVGTACDVECTPLGDLALPGDLVLEDDLCWPSTTKGGDEEVVAAAADGARVAEIEATIEPCAKGSGDAEAKEEDEVGAAAEWLAGLPEPLQPEALTEKALKKFTGVARGPVMSGDGKVTEVITLRVLKSVKAAIEQLNLKKNAAVHDCCGLLDDQEGRAFLVGDLMGIEIVRGERLNESRKLGEQIDELLRGEKVDDTTIRKGIRSRKAKARKKAGCEAKLTELDAEQRRRRAAHWDADVKLNLPDTSAKVKNERERPPPPPPKPPPPRDVQLAAAVQAAEQALEAARLATLEVECAFNRASNTAERVGWPAWEDFEPDLRRVHDAILREERRHEAELAHNKALALRRELAAEIVQLDHELRTCRIAEAGAEFDLKMARSDARHERALRELAAQEALEAQEREERHRISMEECDRMAAAKPQLSERSRALIAERDKLRCSLRQPLAPGPPLAYDLRGDPSTWQLPSPPPSPPGDPPPPPPPDAPPSDAPPSDAPPSDAPPSNPPPSDPPPPEIKYDYPATPTGRPTTFKRDGTMAWDMEGDTGEPVVRGAGEGDCSTRMRPNPSPIRRLGV